MTTIEVGATQYINEDYPSDNLYAFDSIDNINNALDWTSIDDYARLHLTRNGNNECVNFIDLKGFDFSSVPDNAILTRIDVAVLSQLSDIASRQWLGLEIYHDGFIFHGETHTLNKTTAKKIDHVSSNTHDIGSWTASQVKEIGIILYNSYPPNTTGSAYMDLYGVTVSIDYLLPPTITLGTPSKSKISRISGHDQATVTFRSDIALQSWEARATLPGVTTGHGVGLLVESGSTLSANTDATVIVDDEELTNGDNNYTITVYGQSTEGVWSDD